MCESPLVDALLLKGKFSVVRLLPNVVLQIVAEVCVKFLIFHLRIVTAGDATKPVGSTTIVNQPLGTSTSTAKPSMYCAVLSAFTALIWSPISMVKAVVNAMRWVMQWYWVGRLSRLSWKKASTLLSQVLAVAAAGAVPGLKRCSLLSPATYWMTRRALLSL